MYADDVTILHAASNIQEDYINLETNNILSWVGSKGFLINFQKLKRMVISRNLDREMPLPRVILGQNEIERCEELKILGIIFQENLKWDRHVDIVVRKSAIGLSYLRKLKTFTTDSSTLWRVYCQLIFCHICYAYPAWCDLSIKNLNKLMTIENRAMRQNVVIPQL